MKYNNHWLIEKFRLKEELKYLFFWGHQPAKDGSITQSCFSQWWPAPFRLDGINYATAEHWMMAEKARLFNDESMVEKIVTAKSAAEAKKLGGAIQGFDTVVWDAHKFSIVIAGNLHKFSQHEALKIFLLNTNDLILVEASPVDAIWGIGMAEHHDHILDPLQWRGENLLGYALMEVRDMLVNVNLK
jgi:ribA/ribD-fused uncharacterized protein